MQNLTSLTQSSAGNLTLKSGKSITIGGLSTFTGAATGAFMNVAVPATRAGLKIHSHSNQNNSGGTYDYTYINELKGEFVSTSGTMIGLGADYTLSGSGTGAMCASNGYAKLLTGITMSGAATPTAGILTGGQFFANVAGTLNGAGVEVMGLYGGIDYNTGGTLTTCDFMTGIHGEYRSNVDCGTGTSSILRLTKGGTADTTVDFGIILVNSNGAINVGLDFPLTVGTNAGDGTASLIRGGYAASGGHTAPNAPIVFATANQHAMQLYLKSTASGFTGIEMNAYTSAAAAGTQWQYPCVAGEFTVRSLNASASVDNMWAILAQAQVLSTNYGPGTGKQMIAGYFKTGNAQGSGGIAGLSTCIYLDTGLNAQSTQGDYMIMAIANNKAATPLSALAHIAGGMNSVFEFDAVQTVNNGYAWNYRGAVSGTQAGWIKCKVSNGSSYVTGYIPLYPTAADA